MRRLTLRPLDRRILALALPALGALLVEPVYNLTDTAIVGHLGRGPLGGLALASTVLNLTGWTFGFLQVATTSRVAVRGGRGDATSTDTAVASAYLVAGVLGVLLAAAVAVAGPPVAAMLGGTGSVQHSATTYLRVAAVGLPFLLLTLPGIGHLQGQEDVRTPLRVLVLSTAVNVGLELLLVYVAHLGVAGSAAGTDAAQVLAAVLFVSASRRRLRHGVPRPQRDDIHGLLRDGLALVVRTVALGAALAAATAIAAHVGTTTLDAHQIALQVWLLLALAVDALAVPAQVFVGAALGRGDVAGACEVGRRCLVIGTVVGVAAGTGTAAVAGVLPTAFTDDAAVRSAATTGLLLCALLQPFAAAAFVLDGLLLGAEDYAALRRAMLLALLGFAPLAGVTVADHGLGITGIWLALTCWLAARTALLAARWRSRRWALMPG